MFRFSLPRQFIAYRPLSAKSRWQSRTLPTQWTIGLPTGRVADCPAGAMCATERLYQVSAARL